MDTNKKIITGGILFLVSGLITAIISVEPSAMLQYIFVVTALTAGILAIMVGRETSGKFVRSTYYTWTGIILILLAIALGIWATSTMSFIYVMGFFLLILGVVEFVFTIQILTYETPVPWKLIGLKLTIAAMTAVGAAWVMTMAGGSMHTALFFLGMLFMLVGFSSIRISWMNKKNDASPSVQ